MVWPYVATGRPVSIDSVVDCAQAFSVHLWLEVRARTIMLCRQTVYATATALPASATFAAAHPCHIYGLTWKMLPCLKLATAVNKAPGPAALNDVTPTMSLVGFDAAVNCGVIAEVEVTN